jgi:ubiquitin-protein ligase
MAILENDWSPFLSLTSLMESLDKILEQPDEDYAINADVLADFKYNQ